MTTEARHTVQATNCSRLLACLPLRDSGRGKEQSRQPEKILAEARVMVEHGAKELVLLGQIVDRYGLDLENGMLLPQLLAELSEIEGLERIRFLTSHPNWMTNDLIDAVARLPKVMPHIQVPVQAGDNEILHAMRRGYSNQDYRDLTPKSENEFQASQLN